MNGFLRTLVAIGAAGGLLLAACGNDDDSSASDDGGAADEGETEEPMGGETINVTAVDYAFEGLPSSIAAGDTLALTNASDVELHELVAIHIPDDVDLSVLELLELPEEDLDELVPPGPPDVVIIAPPGQDGFVVVGDATLTEPGRYAVICAIPTGADPDEFMAAADDPDAEGPPDVDGGPPHFVEGMYAELIVE